MTNQRREQDNVSSLMGQVLDGSKEIKSFNMTKNLEDYLEKYKSVREKIILRKEFMIIIFQF